MCPQVVAVYARQLEAGAERHKAATYHLLAGNVGAAVAAYAGAHLHAEAVAVARARLAPGAALQHTLATVYEQWAQHSESQGAYEQAAKCYLHLGNTADAVRVLGRRGGARGALCALRVARHTGQEVPPTLFSTRVRVASDLSCHQWFRSVELCLPPSMTRAQCTE